MFVENTLHGVPQIQRPTNCLRSLVVRRHPKREEWSVHPAFTKARDVDHSIREPIPKIDILINDTLNRVVMSIDTQDVVLDAVRSIVRILRRCNRRAETDKHGYTCKS